MRPAVKAVLSLVLALGLGLGPAGGQAQPPPAPAIASPPSAAQPGVTPISPVVLEAFVDGVVRPSMSRYHVAGVAVAVVQNGQILLKKGYGVSHLNPAMPVDPDRTLFRLGEISDSFTWIALMKEAEAGHIRLSQPVNLYLPEKLQIKDQGFKRPILVRDLMTHSAGFEDRRLGQLFEQNPARVRPLADYLHQERPRRVREAGSSPVLSSYGAALAGEAVAYVNGHPFQDIIENEITRPLGMASTTFREPYPARAGLPTPMPADMATRLSTGYRWGDSGPRAQDFEYATQSAPSAAATSSAADMARFMLMILGDGQLEGANVYGPGTAAGFRTTLQSAAPGVNGWDNGFEEFSLPGGFRGQGQRGDTLWFHSSLVTVPALGLGIFVTTNTDTGAVLAASLPRQIVAQFYAGGERLPRAGDPGLVDQAHLYAGTYLSERRAYGGLEKFVRMLASETTVRVTSDGRLLTRGADEYSAWTPDGAPGHFRRIDGTDALVFDIQNGRARHWYPPSGMTAYDRVGPLLKLSTLATLAALALLAAIATLVGPFTRDRRDQRQTATQTRAGLLQTTIAILWVLAMAAFGLWALGSADAASTMYHWPDPLLMLASACAFVAAIFTLVTIGMAPMVWRGGRRLDSWGAGRKLRFTVSTLVYAAFSFVLMLWGALEPWSR